MLRTYGADLLRSAAFWAQSRSRRGGKQPRLMLVYWLRAVRAALAQIDEWEAERLLHHPTPRWQPPARDVWDSIPSTTRYDDDT
jgi:hypothetical protein